MELGGGEQGWWLVVERGDDPFGEVRGLDAWWFDCDDGDLEGFEFLAEAVAEDRLARP